MDAKRLWQLLENVCQLGEFIASTGSKGAYGDIVGRLRVVYDGPDFVDTVLESPGCHDHIHITPEDIQSIRFGYARVSTGNLEPCIELVNVEDQVCLTLWYYPFEQPELKPKHQLFAAQHPADGDVLTGEW